jgi:hypothetical protein
MLEPVRDGVAVERTGGQRLEDEDLEVTAEDGKWLGHGRPAIYTGTV